MTSSTTLYGNASVQGYHRRAKGSRGMATDIRADIAEGRTALGIELGSTRIKAVLIGGDHGSLAVGSHDWENQFVDRMWTYSLEAVWTGLQDCYAALAADVRQRYGVELTTVGGARVSAMMHGYLAFDARRRAADAVPDLAEHQHRRGDRAVECRVRAQHPAPVERRTPVPGDPER